MKNTKANLHAIRQQAKYSRRPADMKPVVWQEYRRLVQVADSKTAASRAAKTAIRSILYRQKQIRKGRAYKSVYDNTIANITASETPLIVNNAKTNPYYTPKEKAVKPTV